MAVQPQAPNLDAALAPVRAAQAQGHIPTCRRRHRVLIKNNYTAFTVGGKQLMQKEI